jgi:hypothetical protein
MNFTEIETKKLIKTIGINLITINVLWIGLLPTYFMSPIYCNLNFYGYKYSFDLKKIIPYIQGYITLKIIYDIKNT